MDRLIEDRLHPGQPRGVVDLDLRRQIGAVVEGADGDLQPAGLAIGQRRAAAGAEAAIDVDRRLEIARLLARPFDAVLGHRHQRAEERAELLLAHAAMADRRAAERAWMRKRTAPHWQPPVRTVSVMIFPPAAIVRCRGRGAGRRRARRDRAPTTCRPSCPRPAIAGWCRHRAVLPRCPTGSVGAISAGSSKAPIASADAVRRRRRSAACRNRRRSRARHGWTSWKYFGSPRVQSSLAPRTDTSGA